MKATHLATRKARLSALILGASLSLWSTQASTSLADYDTPAYIDFQVAEWSVSESETAVELVVHRTGEFRETFRLDFMTVEESATEGQDYQGGGGTLVFQPMETFKTITIGILADDEDEDLETFRVQLSSTEPKAFFVRDSASVQIENATQSASAVPSLAIRAGGSGTIVLSWTAGTACVLERARGINAQNWEPVPTQPVRNGDRYEVQEPVTSELFIYRLKQGSAGGQ